MLTHRTVDVDRDKDVLLELHCEANYATETPWARAMDYLTYRAKWLASGQSKSYLTGIARSLKDVRTIMEIWQDDGVDVGYIWVTFHDVEGYGLSFAEVDDISVLPEHQRRGVGNAMLDRVESLAAERGASWIRAETGIEVAASQGLHAKRGFYQFRVGYEKLLVEDAPVIEAVRV